MLHYFSSQDMMISHTLARHFFWNEWNLWKEDISNLPVTVSISGQDLIVPTKDVWSYLTSGTQHKTSGAAGLGEDAEWKSEKLQVLWFEAFDHAGLFMSKAARRAIALVIQQYSDVT